MIETLSLVMCFWTGFTNPHVEECIRNLESPIFLERKKSSDYLIQNGKPYILRVNVARSYQDSPLDRKKRIDFVGEQLYENFWKSYKDYWNYRWKLECQAQELVFGDDWPNINVLYYWTYREMPFWSGKFFTPNCSDDDIGWKTCFKFNDIETIDSLQLDRRYFYFREFQPHVFDPYTKMYKMRGSWEEVSARLWIMDEWFKGTNVTVLTIALTVMRTKSKLRRELRHLYYDLLYMERQGAKGLYE